MKRWRVTTYETTARVVEVEAETEEEAIDLADETPDLYTHTEPGDPAEAELLGEVDEDTDEDDDEEEDEDDEDDDGEGVSDD